MKLVYYNTGMREIIGSVPNYSVEFVLGIDYIQFLQDSSVAGEGEGGG